MGFFTPEREAVVVGIYEPPQRSTDKECELLEDRDEAAAANAVADLLGLERVGVMVSHPPRSKEEGATLSGPELILSAQLAIEAGRRPRGAPAAASAAAGGGRVPTPFVTVRVTANDKGEAVFDAYQVSEQCMDMVERGALSADPSKPDQVRVDSKFHAIVEAKPAEFVPIELFLVNVPIGQERYFLSTYFPREPRVHRPLLLADLKEHIARRADRERRGVVEALRDLHAVVFIAKHPLLRAEVLPALCDAVLDPDAVLDEGHELLLRSIANEE
jgi:nuclear protein localization family protein 4